MASLLISSPHLLKSAKHPSPPSFQMEMLMTLRTCRPFSTAKCIHLFSDIIYYKRHDCCKDWRIWGWILFHWHFPFTDGRRDFCYSQNGDELRASERQSEHCAEPASVFFIAQENPWRWGRNMAVLQPKPVARNQNRHQTFPLFCFNISQCTDAEVCIPHGFWLRE